MKRIRVRFSGFTFYNSKPCMWRRDDTLVGSYSCGDCEYYRGAIKINNNRFKVRCVADETCTTFSSTHTVKFQQDKNKTFNTMHYSLYNDKKELVHDNSQALNQATELHDLTYYVEYYDKLIAMQEANKQQAYKQ